MEKSFPKNKFHYRYQISAKTLQTLAFPYSNVGVQSISFQQIWLDSRRQAGTVINLDRKSTLRHIEEKSYFKEVIYVETGH